MVGRAMMGYLQEGSVDQGKHGLGLWKGLMTR